MANVKQNQLCNRRAFTITEAARYACVSRGTIKNWLLSGALPHEELPSRGKGKYCFRRIRKDDLDELLNKFYHSHNSRLEKKLNDKLILLPRNS